jgi:hypothetical protein
MRLLVTGEAARIQLESSRNLASELTRPYTSPSDQSLTDPQSKTKSALVNGVFQGLASFEAWDLGSSDADWIASLWVTASTSSTLFNRESTETNQYYGITGFQSASDGFNYCVQRTASNSFRDISRCSDGIDQFRLVHS